MDSGLNSTPVRLSLRPEDGKVFVQYVDGHIGDVLEDLFEEVKGNVAWNTGFLHI